MSARLNDLKNALVHMRKARENVVIKNADNKGNKKKKSKGGDKKNKGNDNRGPSRIE